MTSILQSKAGWMGFGSALIGSFLFALVEGLTLKTNQVMSIAELIRSNFSWIVFVFCGSSIFSVVPGYLGGRILERLKKTTKFGNSSLIAIGAVLGIISVVLISFLDLFVVLSAHNYWSIKNNPAFPVYVSRLIEVVIIAALMGSWSGYLISKS
jgi:hypothetical protein